MGKKKLTFFTGGSETFMTPIVLGMRNDFRVKSFVRGQQKEYYQYYTDTDVAWYEWCDGFTAQMSREFRNTLKHVIRFHSYELFTDFPSKVDWSRVNKVIFVSDVVANLASRKFNISPQICKVINNGIDLKKFNIPNKKTYNKKIAFIGFINYKKGVGLLLQAIEALHKIDPKVQFHIAGHHQDERINLYMDHFLRNSKANIVFDGWQKDMPSYLADKDYVLSTSLFESFQYSIGEGMASGCVPLVHDWLGARNIWPSNFVFRDIYELCEIYKAFDSLDNKAKERERKLFRSHIVNNFNLEDKLKETRDLLLSL